MTILWITNGLLPEAKALLGREEEVKGTGGWVMALSNALRLESSVKIHLAAISDLVKEYTVVEGKNVTYHAIPRGKGDIKYNSDYESIYKKICDDIKPNVVHIHGTELPHSLAALRACGAERTVVSLQGLVSVIARYNNGGISKWEALKNLTFHDIVRGGIIRQQKQMYKSGENEKDVIKECKYVIGRTSFDQEHAWALNPSAHYFHCEEVLRQEFYESRAWDYSQCRPHSIFMSQSAFPIKGVHKVIEALGIAVKLYPDIQLRVAGRDLTWRNGTWKDNFRLTGYGKIVRRLIRERKLDEKVTFTGSLNADGMIAEYLNANVFICPSSIENSPNSLAEAQLLGVPCLGSYVGGIPDMMKSDMEHLYRFDDVEMLAYKICEIFDRGASINTAEIRNEAMVRHNSDKAVRELITAYKSIISK